MSCPPPLKLTELLRVCLITATLSRSSAQSPPQLAARLQDDKNTTVKSRSLESQQQQQQQLGNLTTSTAVIPLALPLPRSSGAVTTPTHSAAIPLPAATTTSPAGTVPDLPDVTEPSGEHEVGAGADQASD